MSNELPSAKEVRERLAKVAAGMKDVRPTPSDWMDIAKNIRDTLGATMMATQICDFEQWYFRARVAVSDPECPLHFREPPAEVTGIGRCNLEGHPVFYGSETQMTSRSGVQNDDAANL